MLHNNLTSKAQDTQGVFRYPAEFEQQQALWFGWEKEDTSVQMVVANIIQAIAGKIEIKMAVSSIESIDCRM